MIKNCIHYHSMNYDICNLSFNYIQTEVNRLQTQVDELNSGKGPTVIDPATQLEIKNLKHEIDQVRI